MMKKVMVLNPVSIFLTGSYMNIHDSYKDIYLLISYVNMLKFQV